MGKHTIAYSVEKITSLSNSKGGLAYREMHNLREDTTASPPPNVNPEKSKDNKSVVELKYNSYNEAFRSIINKNNAFVRKNAVCAAEVVATYTKPEWDKKTLDSWVKDTVEFTKKTFGEDNIINAELHMDEESPHIHFIFVPINDKGRLCYKSFIDGPKSLRQIQSDFANEVGDKYGLMRGNKYKTYRKQANKYENLSRFREATIGNAIMEAKIIAEPREDELRDNGDIIPERYIPRVEKDIENANYSHLKEKNELSAEINKQESDLIGYYMELQEKLRLDYEEKEKDLAKEKEKNKKLQEELLYKLKEIEDFLQLTKGSIIQGEQSLKDIQKSLNTQKYLLQAFNTYPDKKKLDKAKELLNEMVEYGRKQFHEEKDTDIKKIDKLLK
ncbi:MAG: plasmid recombination protein [Lachnospiraceae bacterium]|nr:plasmid recombination protein [Lachnospiraceae bacterium]